MVFVPYKMSFSIIVRLTGGNKSAIVIAFKQLKKQQLDKKKAIISEKPLHVEYTLSEKRKRFDSYLYLIGADLKIFSI